MRHYLARFFQLIQFTTTIFLLLGLMFLLHFGAMDPLGRVISLFG